ncbi:hypothetical protein [Streptomyces sp. NPDC001340]
MIARSRTKTVSIDRPFAEVFAFLADPANWSKWAVVNIKSIEPTEDPDWWAMSTPVGPARLRLRADAELGILDHDYLDDTASWRVPASVVPNGDGTDSPPSSHSWKTRSDHVRSVGRVGVHQ